MHYCSKCGTKIEKTVAFCPSCGTKVATTEPVIPVKNEPVKKKRSVFPILSFLILFISLLALFFLFIKPRYFSEAEAEAISMEVASGYWVSKDSALTTEEGIEYDASALSTALYLDEDVFVLTEDGQDTLDGYAVSTHSIDEEDTTLTVELMDNSDVQKTLTVTIDESDKHSFIFELEGKDSMEMVSVTEEEYVAAGGLDLKGEAISQLDDTDVEEQPSEEESEQELTLSEVTGYYVGRDENQTIDYVVKLTEDYMSSVTINPLDGSAEAFSASEIVTGLIDENVLRLDVLMMDHHSIRERELHDVTFNLVFSLENNPISYQYEGDTSDYVYMTLEDIVSELNGAIAFDLEERLTSLYEVDYQGILDEEDDTDTGNFVGAILNSDQSIWGTYVHEEEDQDGYAVRTYVQFEPIDEIDRIFTLDGDELSRDDLENLGIAGLWDTWLESDNPEGGLGGQSVPTYISDVEYDEETKLFTVYMLFELGDEPEPRYYSLVGPGRIVSTANTEREFILE